MIIYFSEVEKSDERLVNIKNAKLIMTEMCCKCPGLWREFKDLIESVEKEQ